MTSPAVSEQVLVSRTTRRNHTLLTHVTNHKQWYKNPQSKVLNLIQHHQILSELDRLNVTNFYETLEISVLGHFQQFSVTNTYNVLHFIDKDINITRSLVRRMLDDALKVCMTASQRIFMARDCREWL